MLPKLTKKNSSSCSASLFIFITFIVAAAAATADRNNSSDSSFIDSLVKDSSQWRPRVYNGVSGGINSSNVTAATHHRRPPLLGLHRSTSFPGHHSRTFNLFIDLLLNRYYAERLDNKSQLRRKVRHNNRRRRQRRSRSLQSFAGSIHEVFRRRPPVTRKPTLHIKTMSIEQAVRVVRNLKSDFSLSLLATAEQQRRSDVRNGVAAVEAAPTTTGATDEDIYLEVTEVEEGVTTTTNRPVPRWIQR